MNDRLLSLLGLARKAGKVVFGRDCAAEAVRKKQAKLLLLASDLSPKSKKEMEFLGQNGRTGYLACKKVYGSERNRSL